jgi:two-component system response regulator QseB
MLEVNSLARVVRRDGVRVHVTRKGFDLLVVLMEAPTRVVPYGELGQRVWGFDAHRYSKTVRTTAYRLRAALGPGYVHSVHGVGLRLLPADAAANGTAAEDRDE